MTRESSDMHDQIIPPKNNSQAAEPSDNHIGKLRVVGEPASHISSSISSDTPALASSKDLKLVEGSLSNVTSALNRPKHEIMPRTHYLKSVLSLTITTLLTVVLSVCIWVWIILHTVSRTKATSAMPSSNHPLSSRESSANDQASIKKVAVIDDFCKDFLVRAKSVVVRACARRIMGDWKLIDQFLAQNFPNLQRAIEER